MNKGTAREATELVEGLLETLGCRSDSETQQNADIVLCPPYTVIHAVREAIGDVENISIGAQDAFWKESGAYTSQVSPEMLVDSGVRYVILGHSETRGRFGVPEPDFSPDILKVFGETDATINRKAKAVAAACLIPIICIGETQTEREAGHTDNVIQSQIVGALQDIPAETVSGFVFAYEPVWAIGTGLTCSADEADRVCGVVRNTIAKLYSPETAETVRIQYGGSMKPDNAADLLSRENIDGGLIGGASLKAADFAAIINSSK